MDETLEMLDVTESYLGEVEQICRRNWGALELVGGNLLIHIFGVATRTIVTSGARKGCYHQATDDPIHFTFAVQQFVLLHLLDPDPDNPLDIALAQKERSIVLNGDLGVYERFMALGRNYRNVLGLRAS